MARLPESLLIGPRREAAGDARGLRHEPTLKARQRAFVQGFRYEAAEKADLARAAG
jgi:hypothetical protein